MTSHGRKRILFFSENVSLAHLARPLALAKLLPAESFEVFLAADIARRQLIDIDGPSLIPLRSIAVKQFNRALYEGRPIYSLSDLKGYVEEDLRIIDTVRPQAVIGDFRLSLGISARLRRVPYLNITNSYWSPFFKTRFHLGDNLLGDRLGYPLTETIFQIFRKVFFHHHAQPLCRLRKYYGLSAMKKDIRWVYTEADTVLLADIPELYPLLPLPPRHHYLGLVLWEPRQALPDWWDKLGGRPLIYVSLGSSGKNSLIPLIIEATQGLNVHVAISLAGSPLGEPLPSNVWVSPYLPGLTLMEKASVAIVNGGMGALSQALIHSVPTLGIVSNMDQVLCMSRIQDLGLGRMMKAHEATCPEKIRSAVTELIENDGRRNKLRELSKRAASYDVRALFLSALQQAL